MRLRRRSQPVDDRGGRPVGARGARCPDRAAGSQAVERGQIRFGARTSPCRSRGVHQADRRPRGVPPPGGRSGEQLGRRLARAVRAIAASGMNDKRGRHDQHVTPTRSRWGVAYLRVRNTPFRLMSITRSNDASSVCRTVPYATTPALTTTDRRRPCLGRPRRSPTSVRRHRAHRPHTRKRRGPGRRRGRAIDRAPARSPSPEHLGRRRGAPPLADASRRAGDNQPATQHFSFHGGNITSLLTEHEPAHRPSLGSPAGSHDWTNLCWLS